MICFGFLVIFACQQSAPATNTGAAPFCQVAKPIYWSAADTRMTKEQVDELNAVGKRLCGWGKKK